MMLNGKSKSLSYQSIHKNYYVAKSSICKLESRNNSILTGIMLKVSKIQLT